MKRNPNILMILADQLTWRALPAYGDRYVRTPNIDRIATASICYERCYTTYPLCQPARASLWTGLYPHETGVISNNGIFQQASVPEHIPTLGEAFSAHGYDTVHFGKCHDAGALRGFACEPERERAVEGTEAWPYARDTRRDRYTADRAAAYLAKPPASPFFAVVDFVNPHDICSWIGVNRGAHTDVPIDGPLPGLPANFRFDDIKNRPKAVQYICCAHRRQAQAAAWTEDNYRHYLAAYYHYVERLDAEVGVVLDALHASGAYEDTVIVFVSDHGDSMAARGRVTKAVDFYEEVVRVPLMINMPDGRGDGMKRRDHLASLLDIFPTLCGLVGINRPSGLRGYDLLAGDADQWTGRAVVSQWHTEWGYTIAPGRMLLMDHHKYIAYAKDGEELYDLEKDPYEMRSLMQDPAYGVILLACRDRFAQYLRDTKDDFELLDWAVLNNDMRWRSHAPGYACHHGLSAPDVAEGVDWTARA